MRRWKTTLLIWKKQRLWSKTHYNKHKEEVLQRIRKYQKDKLELATIEKLHALQQEKLLDFSTGEIAKDEYDKLVEKLNNKLAHLHMVL